MKYIIDLDALMSCTDLLPKPCRLGNSALVELDAVKELINAFPKDEVTPHKYPNIVPRDIGDTFRESMCQYNIGDPSRTTVDINKLKKGE